MCLALFAIGLHPQYPLIILSNRDEFYERPTVPAQYWDDDPHLFAGQDLVAGGTWLGVNDKGHFAGITNYRNPAAYDPFKLSRGMLVKNYLSTTQAAPSAYIEHIAPVADHYNPFNLVLGSVSDIKYYSSVENKSQSLTSGLYGLSNHLLNTPWYKVLKAKELFNQALGELIRDTDPDMISALLFPILEDQTLAPDHLLPQTGVSAGLEKVLSSIFVQVPAKGYGTRCSTIILFDYKNIFFIEKGFSKGQLEFVKKSHIKVV